MANSFNTDQTSITTASSDTTVFTASASTTLIKSVRVVHASGTSSATLSIVKSGSATRTDMNTVALSQNVLTDLISDVLPLESGDVIKVRTSHQPSEVFVSYVENTTSVSAQSIDVLSDVDISTVAPTDGQVLVWDATNSVFEPGDAASGSGTVTSVGITAGTGISSAGGPITTSGNITVALDASIDDLSDVDSTNKIPNDVLAWDGSNWVYSRRVSLLYELLKEGSSKTITAEPTNVDETEGFVKLEATAAKLKVNNTGVEITETSPGDIEFVVATDSSGSTAFTALHIDGSTTANVSDIIVKAGAYFKFDDGLYTQWIKPTSGNTGNTAIVLPSSSGQLALTTDLYTDSDADARIAAASVTDLTDVSSAGSGAIITSAERTKLSGIATSATANQTDAHLLSRANHTGTQTASTISDFDTEVSNNSDVVANSTKLAGIETGADVTDETNVKAALDGMTLSSATIATGDRLLIQDANASYEQKYVLYDNLALKSYEEDELVSGQNVTMNTGVSVASNKIVDIMGDALADTSNANTKKFLGFHTGSGVCVLKGMVDANNSISGATAGSPLWLGASGSFSATAPTTATYYSRVVGYYIGTLVGGEVMCYFDPSRDWVQID